MEKGKSRSKIVPCIDCGREFPRKELNRKFRCLDCAMLILPENIMQIQNKSGPLYEKWKKGMQAAAAKL